MQIGHGWPGRTGGGSGMLLDGLALLDEGVLGRGQAALHDGAAQLGRQPGDGARDLALGKHCSVLVFGGGFN
jgi:hypothetical protein